MRLYTEPSHPTEKLFLSDEEYKRALRAIVRYCHDVVFIDKNDRFLLAERRPDNFRSGPWFIGGGVKPFTSTIDSLIKTVERETKLVFAPARFTFIGQHRYFFNGGTADLPQDSMCDIFSIHITDEEVATAVLDTGEYVAGSLRAFTGEDIAKITDPFIQQVMTDVWNDLH